MNAKRRIIPVFVPHLGCPQNCVFCNQRKISGARSAPDGAELAAIIEAGLGRNPENSEIQLAFYGGSFTAIPLEEQTALLEGALPFLRDGSIGSLRVSTRPDAIDENILRRLKKYGVSTIELGAQSMSPQVLMASGRGHSREQTEKAARMVKREGFELILQMMTGLPGDSPELSMETARRLIALEPDGVRIYPTVVLRDTPLYDLWREGEYTPHSVREAVSWCAGILPLFEKAGIPVIRLGLNPSEELSGGEAAAGAYHPAFGELVRSEILLEKARAALRESPPDVSARLEVNPSDISAMTGQKRSNILTLCMEFGLRELKVAAGELERGTVRVLPPADIH